MKGNKYFHRNRQWETKHEQPVIANWIMAAIKWSRQNPGYFSNIYL